MQPDVQWTALWYRDNALLHYETLPWDGVTGGLGFSQWSPPPDKWLPGTYVVQIFVGLEWKVVGQFVVSGEPPTPIPSITPTPTISPTITRTPENTPALTQTQITTSTP